MIIIGNYCGIINNCIWNKNMAQKSVEIQEQIQEKPLEAPFFWGFLTWIIPLIGLLLGINLLLTKKEEANRTQGYKIVIAGIVGCIGHVGVPMILFVNWQVLGGWFQGSQILTLYFILYGSFLTAMFGRVLTPEEMDERLGLTSGHKTRKRTTNKKVPKNQEKSLSKNICPNPECGFENEEGSKFCEQCGAQSKE